MAKNKNFMIWVVVDALIVVFALVGWKQGWFSGSAYKPLSTSMGTPSVSDSSAPAVPGKTIPSNNGTVIKVAPQPAPSTTTSGPLDGHTYRIAQFDAVVVPANEVHTVSFAGGRIQAKICNSISGTYVAAYGTMSAKLMSTMMACTGPADVMQIEQIFNTTLAQKATYTVASGVLTISGNGHTIVLK